MTDNASATMTTDYVYIHPDINEKNIQRVFNTALNTLRGAHGN